MLGFFLIGCLNIISTIISINKLMATMPKSNARITYAVNVNCVNKRENIVAESISNNSMMLAHPFLFSMAI